MFSTTKKILNVITLPVVNVAAGVFGRQGIQTAQFLEESPQKSRIKEQFSTVASAVNLATISYSALDFILELIKQGIWQKLNWKQRTCLCVGAGLASASALYTAISTNKEEHILAGSLCGAFSVLTFNVTKNLAKEAAKRSVAPEEKKLLSEPTKSMPQPV